MLLILFLKAEKEHKFVFPRLMLHTGENSRNNVAFSKSTSKTYLKHLIQNCYFIVGYSLVIQNAGIPVRIDAVSFGQTSFYTRMKTNTCLNFFQMVN